ncbi:hypothetical protein AAVH_16924 [Aphelenchoides avenae]|nr:hypothetical protein AAVH_16924 [Aphelenchus avenae]
MLPLEVLKVIFGAVSRADLEALMLVNALFRDIVVRDFNKVPLRCIEHLGVYDGHDYEFIFTILSDRNYRTRRVNTLTATTPKNLDIGLIPSVKGEELFNILLPHSEAWRSGRVESPREFATPTLFESVFSELLFCKRMHVATFECPLDRPFLSLPAVRECSELHVERAHRNLTLTEVTEWLNVDSTSSEPRRMRVSSDVCDFVVTDLLHLLKADFAKSKKIVLYRIDYVLYVPYAGDPADNVVNTATSELLDIGFLPLATFRTIRAERKLIEE